MSIFGSGDASLGHLDVPKDGSTEALTACPQPFARNYFVLLTGTPSLYYAAEISDNIPPITLNTNVAFEANKSPTIFQFRATKGVSQKQLDITVESNTTTAAYLKVSPICEEVQDIKHLDYNGSSLRLSFAKQGRIILSRASDPPLTDSGVWYIGVALKNPPSSGLTNSGSGKTVTLKLSSSFDYNYSDPLYFLVSLSFFGGIVVSLWALFCFRDPYILLQEDNLGNGSLSLPMASQSAFSNFKDNLKSLFSSCWKRKDTGDEGELRPLVRRTLERSPLTWAEIFVSMKNVLLGHWFTRGPKTFSYTTCIVGCVLLVGAFQFVFEDWKLMINDGDRDRCYYNDFCYRVSGYDIPFNLMISNLAYMIHGLILAWSVWVMEAELLAWCHRLARHSRSQQPLPASKVELPNHCIICPNLNSHLASMSVPHFRANPELHAEARKRKYSFSIGYAFAWALVFEGCFSMLYHFCPTKLTFQFDTAFMFVIAGLIVLSLYNGLSYKECTADGKAELPVDSNNFYLYFIVPLYIFNYFGSLYYANPESLGVVMQVFFVICLVAYYLIMFSWAGVKLFNSVPRLRDLTHCDALTKTVLFILVLALVSIVLPVMFKRNFPNIFLFGCIITSLLVISGKVVIQFWRSERSHWTLQKIALRIFQGSYVLVTLGVMGTAVWIFVAKPTTDKVKSPEESRDLNHACAVVGFFDYHDLWHIMSSFSLLMGAYLVLYISD